MVRALLTLVLVPIATLPALAEGPAQTLIRLRPGDRFTAKVRYSNVWNEIALSFKGPVSDQPIRPSDLTSARASLQAASRVEARPIGQDPLFVDMTLSVEVRDGGRLGVTPQISEVRYFDDRNRRWTIQPGARGAREQTERLIKDISGEWRRFLPTSLETEMLEEQLVGAALCLLSGKTVDMALEPASPDPLLPGFEDLLRSELPEALPLAIHKSVAWFFRESIARIVRRTPESASKGSKFEERGVDCEVGRVQSIKGRSTASITGQAYFASCGASFKETLLVDQASGIALEGKAITIRDALRGRDARFGAVRWETKLTDFKPAPVTGKP